MEKIAPLVIFISAISAPSLLAQATQKTAPRSAAPHSTSAAHSLLRPSSLHDKAPEVFKAKFATTQGDFVVEVRRDWSPYGADRFYNLVKYGFYTNASFFRVISGFMVQFGISARPVVARAWASATIPDDPVKQSNLRGNVTFATAGPKTRTTQVFINYGDNSRLDGDGFSPFGRVVEGMEVVDKLYSGYGEGAPSGNGPSQDMLTKEGKPYLDKNFPKLDSIKSASIMP